MDFERVLQALLVAFERHQIRYAAIGGFAVGVLGTFRGTMDVDFLVHRDDLATLHTALTGLGYQRFMQTENVSHYRHADSQWGGLDFIHAFREISIEMLGRAKPVPIFQGSCTMRIAEPEDVIGLKVQAMANDPARRTKELSDIEQLMELYGNRFDWKRIQEFFELFELGEEARRLRTRYGQHAE